LLAAQGISPDRLTLLAQTPEKDHHLGLYNEVDVALDTYPYNGATTTCEALWMGVPVVTLKGQTHTSRMGASILTAAGRPGWVAGTEGEFVDVAAGIAADAAARRHWRLQARHLLGCSELLDETGFTRSFEDMLQIAWYRRGAHTSGMGLD
jgi:protein O-GlcNAc transferase